MPPVGARVELRGLVARPELNGKRGTVTAHAPPRVLVALDDAARGAAPLSIKPDNATPDGAQAGTAQGRLEEQKGRLLSELLSLVLVVSSTLDHGPTLSEADIHPMRNSPAGLPRLSMLQSKAYSLWERAGQGPGVRDLMRKHLKSCAADWEEAHPGEPLEPLLALLRELMAPGGDAYGWGEADGRLHGAFWVMGARPDGAGTTLLSEDPAGPSCVALGMANSIAGTMQRGGQALPALMQLTLLPFCGRLVTDGFMLPAGGPMRPPRVATGAERDALLRRAAEAERDGTLLFYLPPLASRHDAAACAAPETCALCLALRGKLALCGLLRCGARCAEDGGPLKLCAACRGAAYCCEAHQKEAWPAHKPGCRAAVADAEAASAPLTPAEKALARRIAAVPCETQEANTMWIIRRFDYTEAENPMHMAAVMGGMGGCRHMFKTAALEPTPAELLDAFDAAVRGAGVRPTMLSVDAKSAVRGVERVLKRAGITVGYYPPPSPEEAAAIRAAAPPPGWEPGQM